MNSVKTLHIRSTPSDPWTRVDFYGELEDEFEEIFLEALPDDYEILTDANIEEV